MTLLLLLLCRTARTLLRRFWIVRLAGPTKASLLPLLFASAQGLLYTLSLCGLPTAAAQTTTAYSTPVALSTPVQAADGNFYTATSPTSSCNGSVFFHTTGNCGAIYQITPTGVVSLVHTFASDGTEGFDPNPLVIGPDGNIYGMTQAEARPAARPAAAAPSSRSSPTGHPARSPLSTSSATQTPGRRALRNRSWVMMAIFTSLRLG